MWWAKFTLLMTIVIAVTWLFAKGLFWIDKNKKKHPELYKNRGAFQFLVSLLEIFRF